MTKVSRDLGAMLQTQGDIEGKPVEVFLTDQGPPPQRRRRAALSYL